MHYIRNSFVFGNLVALFGVMIPCISFADTELKYILNSTKKISQITGVWDEGWRKPVGDNAVTAGVHLTDLGIPFEHEGRLGFAFGDSFGELDTPHAPDYFAYADSMDPYTMIPVIIRDESGKAQRIDISDTDEEGFEVPSGVISCNGRLYMVFVTDSDGGGPNAHLHTQMRRSLLVVSEDDGHTWQLCHEFSKADGDDFSNAHFINVSMLKADAGLDIELLPPDARNEPVLIWGTGHYRKSKTYLAVIASNKLGQAGWLRYFKGMDSQGNPKWSKDEADAIPVFDDNYIGELAGIYIPEIGKYAISYVPEHPDVSNRGVYVRFTENPWGPYESPQKVFEPWRDRGYTEFMHASDRYGRLDDVTDPGREFRWGGEYAAYLVSPFTRYEDGVLELFYTMSTWNPYQVVLMSSKFSTAHAKMVTEPARRTTMPGSFEWNLLTDTAFFSRGLTEGGMPYIKTSYKGEYVRQGAIWHQVDPDPRFERLQFEVWGGDAEVILIEGGVQFPDKIEDVREFYDAVKAGDYGRIVRVAKGMQDYRYRRPVFWGLNPYDREQLRVLIVDPYSQNWGNVCVSRMTYTNGVQDTVQGLRDHAGKNNWKGLPELRADTSIIKFDLSEWNVLGEAGSFILEDRYDRRFLTSLNEKGFKAAGAMVFPLGAIADRVLMRFYVSGTDGRVLVVNDSKDLQRAIQNNHLVEFLKTSDDILYEVNGWGAWPPGKEIVWSFGNRDSVQSSKYLIVLDEGTGPKGDQFISLSEPELYYPGSGPPAGVEEPMDELTTRFIGAAGCDWGFSGEDFQRSFYDNGTSWFTTFAKNGDDDIGYAVLGIPPLGRFTAKQMRFQVAGTGGSVYFLPDPLPQVPMDLDTKEMRKRIESGYYGPVLHSATGRESVIPIEITWEVEEALQSGGRLIIMDHKDQVPWGFITVSDFELLEQ